MELSQFGDLQHSRADFHYDTKIFETGEKSSGLGWALGPSRGASVQDFSSCLTLQAGKVKGPGVDGFALAAVGFLQPLSVVKLPGEIQHQAPRLLSHC